MIDVVIELKASVVVPTYNRRELLRRTLDSLAKQTVAPGSFEVVVVDDGSTDGTAELAASFQAPYALQYVHQPNKGRSAARNAGVRAARADLIVFLDSDIAVAPTFIAAHLEAHTEPLLVANGPVIHVETTTAPLEGSPTLADMSTAFFATGNVSVGRQHLERAGLFDEDFAEYGWEDLELGDRLRDLGLRAVPAPLARGYHYNPPRRMADFKHHCERERQRGRTAIVYYRKRPTFRVRAKLLLFWPVFAVDKLLFFRRWHEHARFRRWLNRLEANGSRWRLRALQRIVLHHEYVRGMRQGLRDEDASAGTATG